MGPVRRRSGGAPSRRSLLEGGHGVAEAVQAGYRMVEGGADVDEVYAFGWLHHAVVSLVWRP
jgi:hypothetical protein